jgi:hypothetical protein
MYYFLTHSILAARNSDDERGWVQLLVFLIVIMFSAISGLVKSRANKQRQKGPIGPRPRPQPRPQPQAQLQQPYVRVRPMPAPTPRPQPIRPQIRRPVVPESAPEVEPQVELMMPSPAPKPAEPQKVMPILPELDEAETLRRAIIYYEVLGKPVSLRRPEDPIIGR